MTETPKSTADEKPIDSAPISPQRQERRNAWQLIILVASAVSIIIPAYVFFDNIQDMFSEYVTQDKEFQREWLEQDTNEHGRMFKALDDMKLEIANLKRDVRDDYQISGHLVKKKIPDIEKRQDDIMKVIGDLRVEIQEVGRECVRE